MRIIRPSLLFSLDHSLHRLLPVDCGIEVLEIGVTWYGARERDELSDPEWTTLDQLLTSQTFGSLRKVVLDLSVRPRYRYDPREQKISEFERNLILPLFRALPDRRLESRFKVVRLRSFND